MYLTSKIIAVDGIMPKALEVSRIREAKEFLTNCINKKKEMISN